MTCVILHLYYTDLLEYFESYLKNIKDYDLYITLVKDNYDKNIIKKINSKFDNANNIYIYILENRGLDIAPFIYALNKIKHLKYDCILKLHSKKSLAYTKNLKAQEYIGEENWKILSEEEKNKVIDFLKIKYGEDWRDELINALLSDEDKFNHNLNLIKTHPTIKMLGASNRVIIKNNLDNKYLKEFTKLEIPINYSFIAGTMFMVDFKLIMNWFVEEDIYNRFYHKFPLGYIGDDTIAHSLERFFGCLVTLKGYNILGV
jgi:lipopolysaccharide biosynthesis protein